MNTFDINLSLVLAHTTMYEHRQTLWPFAGPEPVNGGDPPAPTASESTAEMLKAYQQYLPGLLDTMSKNILPYEKNMAAAQKELAPIQNQIALDNLYEFGGKFTDEGLALAKQQSLGQAANDLAVLQGPGKELTAAALEAQRKADPEYYAMREQMAKDYAKLSGSLDDPNGGLSGSERAEVERSLARDNIAGGNGTPSNVSVVSNAMQFGQAGAARKAQKQAAISSAVQTASGALPATKSGIDVMQMTLGRPSINSGMTQYTAPGQTGQGGAQQASNILGTVGGFQTQANQINSQRRDTLDRVNQTMSSMPNVSCCWIFMEAYNGNIPWFVRACRDLHYTPEIREGYRRMSLWLVPAMQKSELVKALVNRFMIMPLTEYAGWMYGQNKTGYVYKLYKNFWLSFWAKTGKL